MIDEKSILEVELKIPYSFSTGKTVGKFLSSLKEGKPLMARCKNCGTSFFPPPDACEKCGEEEYEWLEVPLIGQAVLVIELPEENENIVFVKPDGVDFSAPLKGEKDVKKGDRVKITLRDGAQGRITDLLIKKEA